jgi:arsenate reductase
METLKTPGFSPVKDMKTLTIYHNPQCKKSRAGLQYLKDNGLEFTVVEYMKNPLTEKEVEKLLMKLNMKPAELLRTQEDYFKQNLKGKNFEEHEWIKIMVQNPKLIRRPIVEGRYKAVLGDPPENIERIVKH